MIVRRIIIAILLCLLVSVFVYAGGWSPDWPLEDLTGVPQDNYAVYMSNLFFAAYERAAETEFSSGIAFPIYRTVDGNLPRYETFYNWPVGVTNWDQLNLVVRNPTYYSENLYYPITNTVVVSVIGVETVYTNWTWTTNEVVAVIPNPTPGNPDGMVTSVIRRELVRTGGEYVTNWLYDIEGPSMFPYYASVEQGLASNVFHPRFYRGDNTYPEDYYTDTDQMKAFQPTATMYTQRVAKFWYEMGSGTVQAPWNMYTQVVTTVSTTMPFRIYDYTAKQFTNVDVAVTYTNYTTEQIPAVYEGRGPMSILASNITTRVYARDDYVVWTNTYKKLIADPRYGTPTPFRGMPPTELLGTLLPTIAIMMEYYLDTTYADPDGTFDTWYDTEESYVWTDIGGTPQWVEMTNGDRYIPSGAGAYEIVKEVPTWTPEKIYSLTGAGTNLGWQIVEIDNTVYPGRSGWGYVQHVGPFDVLLGEGWEFGQPYEEFVYAENVNIWTSQVSKGGINIHPERDVDLFLGEYAMQPIYEQTLVPYGFSDVFWFEETNGVVTVVTGQQWIAAINGQSFTPQDPLTMSSTQPRYYRNAASNAFFVQMRRDDSLDYNAKDTWVLVNDFDIAEQIRDDWETLLGSDYTEAIKRLHRMGFPTRVEEYKIGRPSCGPSGYYYPGGVLRPSDYAMELYYVRRGQTIQWGEGQFGDWDSAPYRLDFLTWDTLTNWPGVEVDVVAPSPNTTTIPPMPFDIRSRTIYVDDLGALKGGGDDIAYTTLVYTATAPGTNTWIPMLAVEESPSTRKTTSVWTAEEVWVTPLASVTDTYYVASIGHSVTNDGRIAINPRLVQTNDVLTVDQSKGAGGTRILFSVTNRFAMYQDFNWTPPFPPVSYAINQTFFDGMYRLLNKMTCIRTAESSEGRWLSDYKAPSHLGNATFYDFWSFTNSWWKWEHKAGNTYQGGPVGSSSRDLTEGTVFRRRNRRPYWSVGGYYDQNQPLGRKVEWYGAGIVEGRGVRNSKLFGIPDPATGDLIPKVLKDPPASSDQGIIRTSWMHTGMSRGGWWPAGDWPSGFVRDRRPRVGYWAMTGNVEVVRSTVGTDSDVDIYTFVDYRPGKYTSFPLYPKSIGEELGFDVGETNFVFVLPVPLTGGRVRYIDDILTMYVTNTTFKPLHASFDNTMFRHRRNTFIDAGGQRYITNSYDYAQMKLSPGGVSWHDNWLGPFSRTDTYTDANAHMEHEMHQAYYQMRPYLYVFEHTEIILRPNFVYYE